MRAGMVPGAVYPSEDPYPSPASERPAAGTGYQRDNGYPRPGGYPPYAGSGRPDDFDVPRDHDSRYDHDESRYGAYAYVIHEDRPSPPSSRQAPPTLPKPPAGPSVYIYRETSDSREPESGPGEIYGPDDPAYGPPDPSWYERREQEQAAEEARLQASLAGPPEVRGPFEPPPSQNAGGYEPSGPAPDSAGPDGAGPGAAASPGATAPAAAYHREPADEGALGQIKKLYAEAEALGGENLEGHLKRLRERQRELISDYFKEPGR